MPRGSANGQWKGGRRVASNGYVVVRVGRDHHLADARGEALEHRLVMEKTLGRLLQDGEFVHHRNEVKTDNRPENLELKASQAHHSVEHRRPGSRVRPPGAVNRVVDCACGCGTRFPKYDAWGRPRRYATGHNR